MVIHLQIIYQAHLQELLTINTSDFERLKNFFSDDLRSMALLEGCGERSMLDVRLHLSLLKLLCSFIAYVLVI